MEYEEFDDGMEYEVRDYEEYVEYEEYEEYQDRFGLATRNGNDLSNEQVLNFSYLLYFICPSHCPSKSNLKNLESSYSLLSHSLSLIYPSIPPSSVLSAGIYRTTERRKRRTCHIFRGIVLCV